MFCRGQFTVHFDPDIIQKSDKTVPIKDLWESFSQVICPILLFHGLLSDVLTLDIVNQIKLSQPNMRVITINDCGNAPGPHIPEHNVPLLKFLA